MQETLKEIGEAEIKQMLKDIEYYQKLVKELEAKLEEKLITERPYAWSTEEFNINNGLVWFSITQFRPKELSWIRDLPTKKHHIVITPLYKDESKAEKITGVKSYKESTQKLTEAYGGL